MVRAHGFGHGGVPLPEKRMPHSFTVDNAFLPLHATVVLRESAAGVDSRPAVAVGQEVREGQLLASSSGAGSSNIFSPIPGVVRRIVTVKAPEGFDTVGIVLSLEGMFYLPGHGNRLSDWSGYTGADMARIVRDRGIVCPVNGLPLHEVISSRSAGGLLVVSAMDIDPYVRTEETLLHHKMAEIAEGCAMAAKIVEPAGILVAIDEATDRATVETVQATMKALVPSATVHRFRRIYPQNYIHQIAGSLGLTGADGLFVMAPSTLVALHDAIVMDRPQIEQ